MEEIMYVIMYIELKINEKGKKNENKSSDLKY